MLHPYEELEAQLPSMLVEELHALTMHIGHLCELPSSVLAAFTVQHQAKVDVFYNFKLISVTVLMQLDKLQLDKN